MVKEATPSGKRALVYLLAFLGLNAVGAALGGLATSTSVGTWYAGLEQPTFTPPSWIFGPAWTILYGLIAVSAWCIWRERPRNTLVDRALLAYFVQLGLNFLWSPLFFGLRNPFLAWIDILLLLAAIVWMLFQFRRISKTATALAVPYLLWIVFAAALNLEIVRLN